MKIIGISGSIRSGSLNTRLLENIADELPEGVEYEIVSLADLPLYNSDLEGDTLPAAVTEFRDAVASADGVIIASPEYNYSITGVLKNALDWGSRPAYKSPFRNKPVTMVAVAASFAGGARALQHLKPVLLGMASQVHPWPEFLVGSAFNKFDDAGRFTDEKGREFLKALLDDFVGYVDRVKVDV